MSVHSGQRFWFSSLSTVSLGGFTFSLMALKTRLTLTVSCFYIHPWPPSYTPDLLSNSLSISFGCWLDTSNLHINPRLLPKPTACQVSTLSCWQYPSNTSGVHLSSPPLWLAEECLPPQRCPWSNLQKHVPLPGYRACADAVKVTDSRSWALCGRGRQKDRAERWREKNSHYC